MIKFSPMDDSIHELASWIRLPQFTDSQGFLTTMEFDALPFLPVRAFLVSGVPPGSVRGGHGHLSGKQILICVSGRVSVELRLNGQTETTVCEPNGSGLLIDRKIWSKQTYLDPDSSLLVLCSDPYDPTSYIDEYGRPLR